MPEGNGVRWADEKPLGQIHIQIELRQLISYRLAEKISFSLA
jgi:hypothetical protein